jgi:hypothetical protein
MGTMDAQESREFWARQFAGRWYRGPAHLENDFRRFASAYRVPAGERAAVRERARGMLDDETGRRAA